MADITPGSGGTFSATSIEKTLFQAIHFIQVAEKSATEEERFSASKDDTFRMKGSFTLPGKLNRDNVTGVFTVTAEPYLPAVQFSAGTGGTIKGSTFSQFFVDVCQFIIFNQRIEAKNPNSQYNVSMIFDYSANKFSGEFDIPYTTSLSANGAIIETATDWLVT
jgi:hypothetical protein